VKRKLLFITTGLETGGAERILVSLIENLDHSKFEACCLCLGRSGSLTKKVLDSGCKLIQIDYQLGLSLLKMVRFIRLIWKLRPDVVQGWMYQGSVMAIMAKCLWPKSRCVVAIRNLNIDPFILSKSSRVSLMFLKKFIWVANAITYPSKESRQVHENFGIFHKHTKVISNGCDTTRFKPASTLRKNTMREKWGLNSNHVVIGFISRYHPHKGPIMFVKVAKILCDQYRELHFLCVGQGLVAENQDFIAALESEALEPQFSLLGVVDKVEEIYDCLDALLLTSLGEAFPNVLLEALSCGLPCVSTSVGNVAEILKPFGGIVDCHEPVAIAAEVEAICLKTADDEMVEKRRKWVKENYSFESMIENFQSLWT